LLDIQSCQLDIDGDGYEDLFYYEGYNLSINPTPNPPPSMFMNEGKKLNKSFYLGKDIDQPHGVKLLVGDYNNDTFPDIFALVAIDPPMGTNIWPPQDYCHLLFNSADGFSQVLEFANQKGFWTNGCSGDIDNDGDLDIIMFNFHYQATNCESKILWNNGYGAFQLDSSGIGKLIMPYQSELFDIDNDGYLDLAVAHKPYEPNGKTVFSVFWGNGKNFDISNSSSFIFSEDTAIIDIDFANLNFEGFNELILPSISNSGYFIEILKIDEKNRTLDSCTQDYLSPNSLTRFGHIRVQDIDANGFLDIFDTDKDANFRWEQQKDGTFIRK